MRPGTLVDLSGALGIEPVVTSGFSGFTAFSETYRGLLAAMDHPDHLGILMDQIFEDQAAEGVAYLELGVSPRFYAARYGSLEASLAEMLDLARSASATHGVAFGFMPTIDRTAGLENAIEVRAGRGAFCRRRGRFSRPRRGRTRLPLRRLRRRLRDRPRGGTAVDTARGRAGGAGVRLGGDRHPRGGSDPARRARGRRSGAGRALGRARHPAGRLPDVERAARRRGRDR